MKNLLATVLICLWAHTGVRAAKPDSGIPKSFWGKYCPEDDKDCTPREFYIEAKSVWSESHGGCMSVEKVEKVGDALQLSCKDAPKVILQQLPKKKIRFNIKGEQPIIIQKVK